MLLSTALTILKYAPCIDFCIDLKELWKLLVTKGSNHIGYKKVEMAWKIFTTWKINISKANYLSVSFSIVQAFSFLSMFSYAEII